MLFDRFAPFRIQDCPKKVCHKSVAATCSIEAFHKKKSNWFQRCGIAMRSLFPTCLCFQLPLPTTKKELSSIYSHFVVWTSWWAPSDLEQRCRFRWFLGWFHPFNFGHLSQTKRRKNPRGPTWRIRVWNERTILCKICAKNFVRRMGIVGLGPWCDWRRGWDWPNFWLAVPGRMISDHKLLFFDFWFVGHLTLCHDLVW